MKLIGLMICFIISCNVYAGLVGSGQSEFGFSQDNEDNNFGFGARYTLSGDFNQQYTNINSQMQLGSEKGRSLIATSSHEYQYEKSYIYNDGQHVYRFPLSGISWNSQVSQKINFENDVKSSSSEIRTDYSKINSDWSITTGPSYKYDRSKWVDVYLDLNFSRQSNADTYSNEFYASAGAGKSLTKLTKLIFEISRVCSYTDNSIVEDVCRQEFNVSLGTRKKQYEVLIRYGASEKEGAFTDLYSIDYNYRVNRYSEFKIGLYKSIDKISDENNFSFEGRSTTLTGVKQGGMLSYMHEWRRKRITINANKMEMSLNSEVSRTEYISAFYEQKLGSRLCLSCQLQMSYEYSDLGENRISSIGIRKNNSKRMSTAFSFRKTESETGLDYWSINLLISYNGKETKFGYR